MAIALKEKKKEVTKTTPAKTTPAKTPAVKKDKKKTDDATEALKARKAWLEVVKAAS